MNISDLEVRTAYRCVAEVVHQRTGEPIPAPIRDLFIRLHREIRSGAAKYPEDPATPDPIDSATAAGVLGCTPRRVQQLASDLDGVRVGGRWLFSRRIVEEYAEALRQRPA
ncbi:helix-turn-helix domain-containing protein [Nocardia sp. NEAU-G5]|uniref:Helix-turn-helix domain-containing protein n=1 Tax=Nocardia albiluteola TaxID=2842303 RepID=A0ABS6B1R7_9NOCA|nr:helix-turn-helix domain-containing protein [Nocardia albiluteola]MBU3064088.1 helix-turn-helix domain-containing protein [Nocardia albiluteola]